MPPPIGADSFHTRLRQGLDGIGFASASPADVARAFNRRHPGAPITAHATRKWLRGEAIPTQVRLRSLAVWLEVSPAWLVYGHTGETAAGVQAGLEWMVELQWLDTPQNRLVRQLVRTLLKLQLARAKKDTGKHAPVL